MCVFSWQHQLQDGKVIGMRNRRRRWSTGAGIKQQHAFTLMFSRKTSKPRTCISCISSLLNKSIVIGLPWASLGAIYAVI